MPNETHFSSSKSAHSKATTSTASAQTAVNSKTAPTVTSFAKGLRVLTAIADSGSIRAQDLAAELDLPLSTTYRYLGTLREFSLVEELSGRYVAGWRLSELSRHDISRTRLLELGHETLRQITSRTGETAVLTVRSGTSAVCLRQVESAHAERTAFRLDQLLPLYAGTGQRVLLAHAPQSLIDYVLKERVRPVTERTLTADMLQNELARIRRDGWAVSRGELTKNSLAVAVPVFASGHEVVCSLATAGLESRCGPVWVSEAKRVLAYAAEELSAKLNGADPR